MAHGQHKYQAEVRWTGNRGSGTSGYGAYGRDHVIRADGKPEEAKRLHHVAHGKCYIANSVNFPITCEPTITLAPD